MVQESGPQEWNKQVDVSDLQRREAPQNSQPSLLNVLKGKLRTRIYLRQDVESRTEKVL